MVERMDVTSLLNTNGAAAAAAAAAEQQMQMETEGIRTRSRTPWDAGGYSLPINTVSLAPTPLQKELFEESQTVRHTSESPKQHKFSDSRSSLSSFASSLQSASHSRFSSMSTVNSTSNLPLTSVPTECMSPKVNTIPHLDLATVDTRVESRPSISLSPTGSLETLAIVAENHSFPQQSVETGSDLMERASSMGADGTVLVKHRAPGRPSSPSDAILIKRTAVPNLRLKTGDDELIRSNQQSSEMYFEAPPTGFQQFSNQLKSHKRSASAPDFPPGQKSALRSMANMSIDATTRRESVDLSMAQVNPSFSFNQNFRMTAEPTPPSSHHPDAPSPTGSLRYPNPDTPPHTEPEQQVAMCMYIPNCDTESQLRKAISHIFGRNKMCTRLIPQLVWVHYCRKHYQRSRYRNPKEYAKLQCDLVQEQIRRIHDWSESNAASGAAGVVQDWGLSVRKREAKRLEDAKNKKRRAAAFEHDRSEDEDMGSTAFVPPTAVPQWLLDSCGKGYTTQQILDIFNRLHTAVLQDLITQFPDIEILPNIIIDQEAPKSPKGYAKRTPSLHTHRRSQSLGVSMTSNYAGPNRRASQPSVWGVEDMSYGSPVQKRRRANEQGEEIFDDHFQQNFHRGRPMETGRRIQQPPHRPVFANIEENPAVNENYGDMSFREPFYSHSPHTYQQPQPLPAPIPQRSNSQSMAAHLEISTDNSHNVRRPTHHRSQSDMSGFARGRMAYSASPTPGYVMDPNLQARTFMQQGQSMYTHGPPPQQYRQEMVNPQIHPDLRMTAIIPNGHQNGHPGGHLRHQSTPMIPQAYLNPPTPYGRDSQPFQQPRQYPYPQTRFMGHMQEQDQGRDMYHSRH